MAADYILEDSCSTAGEHSLLLKFPREDVDTKKAMHVLVAGEFCRTDQGCLAPIGLDIG